LEHQLLPDPDQDLYQDQDQDPDLYQDSDPDQDTDLDLDPDPDLYQDSDPDQDTDLDLDPDPNQALYPDLVLVLILFVWNISYNKTTSTHQTIQYSE